MTTPSDTPIADQVAEENPNGAPTDSLPWPNQEPVRDGIGDVSQDPNFVADVVDTEVTS